MRGLFALVSLCGQSRISPAFWPSGGARVRRIGRRQDDGAGVTRTVVRIGHEVGVREVHPAVAEPIGGPGPPVCQSLRG